MNLQEILLTYVEPILSFIVGGGLSAFLSIKYTRKTAQADAMKAVQDVYQETIQDLRSDKEIIKKENLEMKEQISELENKVKQNSIDIEELKSYKCVLIDCKKRKRQ